MFEALLYAGGVGAVGLHVLAEELASRDALPFEVLGKSLKVFLTVGARGAEEEDAANCKTRMVVRHTLENDLPWFILIF